MTRVQTRAASVVLVAALSVFAGQGRAEAAQAGAKSGDQQIAQAPTIVVADQDAGATRERLMEVLRRQPASLGRVLKLDPSLLANQAYLAPYPALATFLAQHPEVAHNPSYFLQNIETSEGSTYRRKDSEGVSLFREMFGDFIAFAVFLTVVGVVIWFVRQIVDYRRWNRLAKVQADAHGKLFDKLSSNEELIAYMSSRRRDRGFSNPRRFKSRPAHSALARRSVAS